MRRVDNDCDGLADLADPALVGAGTWYLDMDGDLYGDPTTALVGCTSPPGYVDDASDCDDGRPDVNPAAVEVCNTIDDDCDGLADDDDPLLLGAPTWHADADEDTFGSPDPLATACVGPLGAVLDATDCDDGRRDVNPAAVEVCNTIDDDCDLQVDDEDAGVVGVPSWYADTDGDLYGDPGVMAAACVAPSEWVADASDCDDGRLDVNPAAPEVCNTIDDDCDRQVDDADPDWDLASTRPWHADRDGDGFGDPLAATWACAAPDGSIADATDCDDDAAAVHPGALEVCNTLDDNCDALADDEDPLLDLATATQWHADTDGDGFGDPLVWWWTCVAPAETVTDAADCDDQRADAHPGATEVCNGGLDDDCDEAADDLDPDLDFATAAEWYADADADGFGSPADLLAVGCAGPDGSVDDAADCDDTNGEISPDAPDVCEDGIDQDCSGADAACVLLSGRVDPDTSFSALVYADQLSATFGVSGAVLDWNGDGQDDLVVSSSLGDFPLLNSGAVFVYYGPLGGELDWEADADVTIFGSRGLAATGSSVSRVPDLNGDGLDEITVNSATEPLDAGVFLAGTGSGFADDLRANSARSQLSIDLGDPDEDGIPEWAGYYGSSLNLYEGLSATPTATLQAARNLAWTGVDGGDLDGDGVDDFAGGVAFASSQTQSHAGVVFVFSPPYQTILSMDWTDATVVGVDFYHEVGWGVAVGDIDGDGYEDLFAGSRYDDNLTTNAGAWYGWLGPLSPGETPDTADVTIFGSTTGDELGHRPMMMRDLDGDGAEEITVSSTLAATEAGVSGAAYLLNGPVTGVVLAGDAEADGAYLPGANEWDGFGTWTRFADDLTGDGGVDLVVSASNQDWNGTPTGSGAVYIFQIQ